MKRRALLTATAASLAGVAVRAAYARSLERQAVSWVNEVHELPTSSVAARRAARTAPTKKGLERRAVKPIGVLESAELELSELKLPGDPAFGRALLAVPRALPANAELLVLLHGLGETVEQGMGARAFAERYGLLTAVSRVSHPPVVPLDVSRDYFGASRTSEINARLAQRPYRCPILVCPFTPNTYKAGGEQTLARFASFVPDVLKAEVERRTGKNFATARCMLAGVSLGGYLAIELFLKRPEVYCGIATVQGAFGPQQAARYAKRISEATLRVGPRRVEVLTSSLDPYRRPNELFHQHLQKLQQSSRLRVSPGPHDQRWLNESGVIELLLAADDVFAAQRGGP